MAGIEQGPDCREANNRNPKRPREALPPAERDERRVRRASGQSLDELRTENLETQIDNVAEGVGGAIDGIGKTLEKAEPHINKLFELHDKLTEKLRAAVGPYAEKLQKLGIELPVWLTAGTAVIGLHELEGAVKEKGKTLKKQQEDGENMKKLKTQHKELEALHKQKGQTYTFEQYQKDIASGLPATQNEWTLAELLEQGKKLSERKTEDLKKLPDQTA